MHEPPDQRSEDERGVRERLELVRDLLQAHKARRGAHMDDALASLRSSISSFTERARSEGWMQAFDKVVAELRAAELLPGADVEVRELVGAADYLAAAEPLIARLAQAGPANASREAPVMSGTASFLAASEGVPALHPLRGSPRAWPLANEGPAFVEPGALEQLRVLSRDVLDEIASLALLRVPGDDEPWTIGVMFEERLLRAFDAAVALSRGPISVDIVNAARARAEDSPVAEPYGWFVPTFLLASTEGERAMDALRETLLEAPPGTLEGLVDGLCLGSNPARAAIGASLIEEDDQPELLCVALDVITRLRRPSDGSVLALLQHPDPRVAARAAIAAPLAQDPREAVRALLPFLDSESLSGYAASAIALIEPRIGAGHLREVMRRGARETSSEAEIGAAAYAAEPLAALGQACDEDLLLALAGRRDAALRAIATHGSPAGIQMLRAELTRGSATNARMEACIRALERLTGIAPLDDPSPGGYARERAAWIERVLSFVPPPSAARVRFGRPFHASMILDELKRPETRACTRRALAREAQLLGAPPLDIDIAGWVALQRAGLASAWRESGGLTALAARRGSP